MPVYYLVVEESDGKIVPLAQFNLKRHLKDDERKKIARQLSGGRMFRWGIGFGLRKLRLGKGQLKEATLMTEEELREKGVNLEEYPVIQVPGVLG